MAIERKWADFELEDEGDVGDLVNTASGFETRPDEHGIKTVTSYVQTARGDTLKIVKRIKVIRKYQRVNREVYKRREQMRFFGAEALDDPSVKASTVRSHEQIFIEIPKDSTQRFRFREEEDEDDMHLADVNATKTTRDLRQRFKALREDEDAADADNEDMAMTRGLTKCVGGRYRRDAGDPSRDMESKRREECTVRVTNLSEDVKDDDLTELFGKVGKIDRIYLAKHKEKKCSKGFAFITYATKEDASRAIRQLNRHGYDNLLLNVEWAKPSARDR